jgi:hypothetical protein
MTFDPQKFLQNVELKLHGRAAVVVAGQAAFVVSLWLLLKDYSDHPTISAIGGAVLLIAMIGFTALGLLGKVRPDEPPEKSITHVNQFGIVIMRGIGSQKDLVQVMRELRGMKRIPPPTHAVRGSAANEANYVPLTNDESRSLVEQIEQGVEQFLEHMVKEALEIGKRPQVEDSVPEVPTESLVAKGKKLSG